MKLNGFVGKGTGKLGSSVFAVSGGEQIVRQYNPNVSNPSTDAQVEQRAKLKLMSQLAADMASAIAFRKSGLVSARNKFISANIGKADFVDIDGNMTARIDSEVIDLTGGSSGLPQLADITFGNNVITVKLSAAAASDVKRVVYNVFAYEPTGRLYLHGIHVVSEAGEGRDFQFQMPEEQKAFVFLAYGIKDANAKATQKFEEYFMQDAADNAILPVLKSLTVADYSLTNTVGKSLE